jgi:putative membrane protein
VSLSLDPGPIVLLLVALALYARATVVLRRRGPRVPVPQQVAWYAGLLLLAVALVGPLDALAGRLVSAHMAQHVLIADVAAPLMLIGIRTPVLLFFLPRPALVALARRRWLRRAFSTLTRPLVAIVLYIAALYAWHLGVLFEAALRNDLVHALQHASFTVTSALVWWAVLEPQHAHVRGELWKAGLVLGARLAGTMLGMAFLAMRAPAYADFYGDAARAYGLTPLADQQIGGGLMMVTDLLVMLAALAFFFWRAAQDDAAREASAADERPAALATNR